MTDVERLLAGRKLIEEYQATASSTGKYEVNKLSLGLKEFGFDSIDTFYKFNEKSCYLERIRCYKTAVGCDGCPDRPRTCYPGCIEKYPAFKPASKSLDTNELRTIILKRITDGTVTFEELRTVYSGFQKWRLFPNHVSANCTIRYEKIAELEFDVCWGIPAIRPKDYENAKLTWEAK